MMALRHCLFDQTIFLTNFLIELKFRFTPEARSALQSNSNFMNKIEATI